MQDTLLRQQLAEMCEGCVLFDNPSFDHSIIGTDSNYTRLIYDYDLMVEELCQDEGWDYETAMEFIEYNTLGSLGIPGAPIVLRRLNG